MDAHLNPPLTGSTVKLILGGDCPGSHCRAASQKQQTKAVWSRIHAKQTHLFKYFKGWMLYQWPAVILSSSPTGCSIRSSPLLTLICLAPPLSPHFHSPRRASIRVSLAVAQRTTATVTSDTAASHLPLWFAEVFAARLLVNQALHLAWYQPLFVYWTDFW